MSKLLFFIFLMSSILVNAQDFDWQGHRGARGLMPENSLPGFKKALELGVKTLEMDVVISKDKKVVVSHDPWFSSVICKTPSGKAIDRDSIDHYNLFQMTYQQIRQFDCGSSGHPDYPDQQKMKVSKPLLVDVIRMAEKYCKDEMRNEVYYNIEIKSRPEWDGIYHPEYREFSDLVYQTIDAYLPWKRVTIQSFHLRVLEYFHSTYPDVKLAVLVEFEKNPEKVLDKLGFTPSIYSPSYRLLKKNKVEALHEKGMEVIPWTVNTIPDMREMIEMGVDGIITDYPNLMMELDKE